MMKRHLLKKVVSLYLISVLMLSCSVNEPEIPVYLNLLTEVSTMEFDSVELGTEEIKTYRIAGTKLESDVNLTISGPFQMAKNLDGPYSTSISVAPDEFENDLFTVYVKFEAQELGEVSGQISHETAGYNGTPVVQLLGAGISDPSQVPNLLAADNFDYPIGPIPSTDRTGNGTDNAALEGWVKVRAANSPINLVSPALEYPGYTGSGRGNSVEINFTPPGANSNLYAMNLSEQQNEDFEGSYYVSVLIQVNSYPAEGQFNRPVMLVDWIETSGATDFNSAIQVANEGGQSYFGIKLGGEGVLTDITPELDKTYLVVLKHTVTDTDMDNGNNETSIFVFDGNIPSAEPEEADATSINGLGDSRMVKGISLLNDNSAAGSYLIDGLKVSHTWEDLFK